MAPGTNPLMIKCWVVGSTATTLRFRIVTLSLPILPAIRLPLYTLPVSSSVR